MRFLLRNVKRTIKIIIMIAGLAVVSVPVTLAYMRARFSDMTSRGVPDGPEGRDTPVGDRSISDISASLEEIPFKPVRPLALGFARAAFNNSFLLFMNTTRATTGHMYPYPDDFEQVVIESFDGTLLTAAVGIHGDGKPRPGLVLAHGFMGSKNDHYIVDTALTAFAGWGFNVLGLDLRNFGQSQCLSHSPTTAGWKEGEDMLAAAKFLSEKPQVTTVGITGFSMGAGSTMRAAYMAREYPYLTGGAIAWNGYADAKRMVNYINTRPAINHPFYPVYQAFRLMHKLRKEDMKKYIEDPELLEYLNDVNQGTDFTGYVEKIAAPHYGVSADEYYRSASSREFLADVEVPLLVIHAADDPICPPSEMDELIEIAEDNPNVSVWMLPGGNHCMFMYFDRKWYESVMRNFFSYWARWE